VQVVGCVRVYDYPRNVKNLALLATGLWSCSRVGESVCTVVISWFEAQLSNALRSSTDILWTGRAFIGCVKSLVSRNIAFRQRDSVRLNRSAQQPSKSCRPWHSLQLVDGAAQYALLAF
jgi:hypothetical protein